MRTRLLPLVGLLAALLGCRPETAPAPTELQPPVPRHIDPGVGEQIGQRLPIAIIGPAEAYRHALWEAMRRTACEIDLIEVEPGGAVPDLGSYQAIYLQRQTRDAETLWGEALNDAAAAGCDLVPLGGRGEPPAGLTLAPAATIEQVQRYFAQPSVVNLARFLRYAAITYAGLPGEIEDPEEFPAVGFFHPDAPGLFGSLAEYLTWRPLDPSKPVVVMLVPEVLYFTANLGIVDALQRELELFANVVTSYGPLPEELQPDLVVPIWPAHLVADERGFDFTKNPGQAAPILQPVRFNEGTLEDWTAGRGFRDGSKLTVWFAGPEVVGTTEPTVVGWAAPRESGGLVHQPIPERVKRFARRAERWCALRRKPAAEKRICIVHYRQRAAYLDTRESLIRLLTAMRDAGYQTGEIPSVEELGRWLDATDWPIGDDRLAELQAGGGWNDALPVSTYLDWFGSLPEASREAVTERWGEAPGTLLCDGKAFRVPRITCGNVTLVALPPRADPSDETALYHSLDVPPTHLYLAFYHWIAERLRADAIVHLGTHGTLEFTPRNNAGLSAADFPDLLLGDLPNINPYMINNPQEAITARRRGMAVTISHNVPAYAATDLPPDLAELHDAIMDHATLDPGAVKDTAEQAIVDAIAKLEAVPDDLRQIQAVADRIAAVHEFCHQVAAEATPQGVHTLGDVPSPDEAAEMAFRVVRDDLARLLLPPPADAQLGWEPEEETPLRELVAQHLAGEPTPEVEEAVSELLATAADYRDRLLSADEVGQTLAALAGEWIPSSVGGDPVKNPETQPTGRNIHGLQPQNIPSKAAYEVAGPLAEQLLERHRQTHGELPDQLAFVLFGGEAIRHHGVSEAQILWLLGVEPVWQRGGSIGDLKLIDRATLGRPRIDCVITCTGQYRDVFADSLKLLQRAVELAASAEDEDNTLRPRIEELTRHFLAAGNSAEEASLLASSRVFAPAEGNYGAVEEVASRSDTWQEESRIGDAYLDKLGHAYGRDELWGQAAREAFSQVLKDVDAAVMSRSSHLYAMLDTDHPYGFLGGLSSGVVASGGTAPELYVSNLKSNAADQMTNETTAEFMSRESQARYFNPQWIGSMKAEGHAGALQMADFVENLWGWNATADQALPADMWNQTYEVYIADALDLGLPEFLTSADPGSLEQMTDRLAEAATRGYWPATDAQLAKVAELNQQASEAVKAQQEASVPGGQATTPVSGKLFEEADQADSARPSAPNPLLPVVGVAIALLFLAGFIRQARRRA